MEIGGLKKEAGAAWYLITGDQVEETAIGKQAAFKILTLKPATIRKLQAEAVKPLRKVFTGRRRVNRNDDSAQERALLHAAVLDWVNLTENGVPVPCTDEMKDELDDNWLDFAGLWRGIALSSAVEDEEVTGN